MLLVLKTVDIINLQ